MSWREHWPHVNSSVVEGDVITGCRDNDTGTYRLFVNKGLKYVPNMVSAHTIESCKCCDLSIEDLKNLYSVIGEVILAHKPFPPPGDD